MAFVDVKTGAAANLRVDVWEGALEACCREKGLYASTTFDSRLLETGEVVFLQTTDLHELRRLCGGEFGDVERSLLVNKIAILPLA
ncbi:hypothetical protein JCM10450v2_000240 [Rhodotorula kratochvilovae]